MVRLHDTDWRNRDVDKQIYAERYKMGDTVKTSGTNQCRVDEDLSTPNDDKLIPTL